MTSPAAQLAALAHLAQLALYSERTPGFLALDTPEEESAAALMAHQAHVTLQDHVRDAYFAQRWTTRACSLDDLIVTPALPALRSRFPSKTPAQVETLARACAKSTLLAVEALVNVPGSGMQLGCDAERVDRYYVYMTAPDTRQ